MTDATCRKRKNPRSLTVAGITHNVLIFFSILKVGKESEFALLEGDVSGNGATVDVIGP